MCEGDGGLKRRSGLAIALAAALLFSACGPAVQAPSTPEALPPGGPTLPPGAITLPPGATPPPLPPGAPPGAVAPPPGAPAGSDLPVCVERAAGMTFQQVLDAVGGSLAPGQLAQGPLGRLLAPDKIAALEACFTSLAPPSGPPAGFRDPNAPATALRDITAQEKAALQATADRVRASAVVVGEMRGGVFSPGGSGFVYSADGLIMTNSHVVAALTGAPRVMLADGRVLAATVLGRVTSLQPDVGVLRVSATGLAPAAIGDSNSVRSGDPLLVVGHPRGFGYWLATGGQAYGQRDVAPAGVTGFYAELISNVPNAPGGSGAPVFNVAGEVVGLLFAGSGTGEPGAVTPAPPAILRDAAQWSSVAERPRTTAVAINDAAVAAREIVARGDLRSWSRPGNIPQQVAGLLPDSVVEPLPTAAPRAEDAGLLQALDAAIRSVVHIQTWRGGERYATATGLIMSADGYILTNAHNVDEGVDRFDVTFQDGRTLRARLVGIVQDQSPDVGVLKVEATGLRPAAVGSAPALRAGDALFLIGHPAMRGAWRISAGTFSRLDTSSGHTEVWGSVSFAAGNSGGPLVNDRGEIVGLFHGSPPLDPAPIEPAPPAIVWGWHAFDQLFGADDPTQRTAAAVAIGEAMQRAQQIIQRQGNVP